MDREKILEEISKNVLLQFSIIAITLLFYIFTKHPFFGFLVFIEIFGIVIIEVALGVKKKGIKSEIKDTVIALISVVVFWFALSFILQTSSPLNAVVSCSMLPSLERGDMIILYGMQEINAHEFQFTEQEFQDFLNPILLYENQSAEIKGSIFSYCMYNTDIMCDEFSNHPERFREKRGPVTLNYGECKRYYSSENIYSPEPCLTSITYHGEDYYPDFSHDTIVYGPGKEEYYYLTGDIIHRVYFTLDVEGEKYHLTKGDNNPVLDIQVYNYPLKLGNLPISMEKYKGKVLFRIPYIGYLKLFISGFFSEDEYCKTQLEYSHL